MKSKILIVWLPITPFHPGLVKSIVVIPLVLLCFSLPVKLGTGCSRVVDFVFVYLFQPGHRVVFGFARHIPQLWFPDLDCDRTASSVLVFFNGDMPWQHLLKLSKPLNGMRLDMAFFRVHVVLDMEPQWK